MQHTQQLFLEALKAALKNEQVEWNNKLEAQEWMDLFRMAEVHQILPMIYEAVYRSPAAGQADPQILAPAKAQMVRTVIMQTQKTGEFEPLYRYLRESGICPLVVKRKINQEESILHYMVQAMRPMSVCATIREDSIRR